MERSSLPVRRTLDQLGIARSTFYGWYELYREGGDDALVVVDGLPHAGSSMTSTFGVSYNRGDYLRAGLSSCSNWLSRVPGSFLKGR